MGIRLHPDYVCRKQNTSCCDRLGVPLGLDECGSIRVLYLEKNCMAFLIAQLIEEFLSTVYPLNNTQ